MHVTSTFRFFTCHGVPQATNPRPPPPPTPPLTPLRPPAPHGLLQQCSLAPHVPPTAPSSTTPSPSPAPAGSSPLALTLGCSPLARTTSTPILPGHSLLRSTSLNSKKSAPNRVCCNALLAAYARATPCQWRKVGGQGTGRGATPCQWRKVGEGPWPLLCWYCAPY